MNYLDLSPKEDTSKEEILAGLSLPQKIVSPKYLYDARGSELFEKICEVDEYYPTRTELSILKQNLRGLKRYLSPDTKLIEFGSGSSEKTRLLLKEAPKNIKYFPVDISKNCILESAQRLISEFPHIKISPVIGDFMQIGRWPSQIWGDKQNRLIFFPGSTIGNLHQEEAQTFLSEITQFLGERGKLLIGVDLIKPTPVLEAAYNDEEGATAAFNLNVLERINRELGANFCLSSFRHRAVFNEVRKRIEMHLVSLKDQTVTVGHQTFRFKEGEYIHTESSYKYTIRGFLELASKAGLASHDFWTDIHKRFCVFVLESRMAEEGKVAASS